MAKRTPSVDCIQQAKVLYEFSMLQASEGGVKDFDTLLVKVQEALPGLVTEEMLSEAFRLTEGRAVAEGELYNSMEDIRKGMSDDKRVVKAAAGVQAAIKKPYRKDTEGRIKIKGKDITQIQKELEAVRAEVEEHEFPGRKEMNRVAGDFAKLFVEQGITDRESLLTKVHAELKEAFPQISREETGKAISGYGIYRLYTKDEDKRILRDIKDQLLALSKIYDSLKGVAPIKTGRERPELSEDAKRLGRIARRMGDHATTTDPERQLTSAVQRRKKYVRGKIESLKKQIEKRERKHKAKKAELPTDGELEQLIAESKRLEEELNEIVGKVKLTDKEWVEKAVEAAEKSEERYLKRIKDQDFSVEPSVERELDPELQEELEEARGRRDKAKKKYLDANPIPPNLVEKRRVLADLENIISEGGIRARPKPRGKDPRTEEISEKIRELRKVLHNTEREKGIRYWRQIHNNYRKMRELEYAVPVKREEMSSNEVLNRIEYMATRSRRRLRQRIHSMKPKTVLSRLLDVGNFMKFFMTSADLSAVGNQGFLNTGLHPIKSARAGKKMLVSLLSPYHQHKMDQELENRPSIPRLTRAGIYISDTDGPLSLREENVMTNILQRIEDSLGSAEGYIKGTRLAKSIKGMTGLSIEKAVHWEPLSASGRAYVTYLNWQRVLVAETFEETLSSGGGMTSEQRRDIAHFVNVSTGRGTLGDFESASSALAVGLFSGRFLMSRFQYILQFPYELGVSELSAITGIGEGVGIGKDPKVRRMLAWEYAKLGIGLAAYYGMLSLAFDDDDDNFEVVLDITSSNFGKVRIGKTWVDPLGGFSQTTVILGRNILNETTSAVTGETRKLYSDEDKEIPYGMDDLYDVNARFFRSKISPLFGLYHDYRTGTDMTGRPFRLIDVPSRILVPMAWRDIYEVMKEEGVPAGSALSILTLMGVRLQTYSYTQERQDKIASGFIRKITSPNYSGDREVEMKWLRRYGYGLSESFDLMLDTWPENKRGRKNTGRGSAFSKRAKKLRKFYSSKK